MNKQNGFTVLEVVVVVLILSIVAGVGISKFYYTQPVIHTAKIKSDISLIRLALSDAKTASVLKNEFFQIKSLDNAQINIPNENLFTGFDDIKLLSYPIISSTSKDAVGGNWVKMSNDTYRAYVSKNDFIDFKYNSLDNSFECDYAIDLCKELRQ
ncbi:prepilin-type N-terminal cleavage/methylation domain-containing protein [Arcobacter sp. FWKO B]|uniref:prepilin-type N-terminal cleavage/methylation domain-containing protein n=1 Tax=Arcobacter sp. FWKO B TaxID=2593672 RepID=UPI0018A507E6|nr:prepilin-type N-terminal cleavage/methylation domain-containing protein [Arcobacter sp. FWKO B]QOG11438.1 prepilin-type N-terminal cleavage/methylation domain-containing protein [Arcobacter sp. FWKO B]